MLSDLFSSGVLRKLLSVLLLFFASNSIAQLQIKKNEVLAARKKGVTISYTYRPLKSETQGIRSAASTTEYEFSFLIQNTSKDTMKLNAKINFETGVHASVIEFNEELAPLEKKITVKNIVFHSWKQYWVDRPTVEKMRVEKL